MKRLSTIFLQLIRGISKAVVRFPLTVLCLVGVAGLVCYLINLKQFPAPLIIEKLIFTLAVGAFIGIASQFAIERFQRLARMFLGTYGVAALLLAGYFFILWPAPEISNEIIVRSAVAIFALFCLILYLPSYRGAADFNRTSLVHFKSFFVSGLYSGVMSGGLAAILFAVDILLFPVSDDAYAYTMTIVWILFAPIYYMSLLPKFNAEGEEQESALQKSVYPKFLEILVSYIAIPLFTAYTLVLVAYFIKILATKVWPSGQLGPMVLAYSAIGILLFILCGLLENRFAHWFRLIFPKVLIPIVLMQLVAVWIRLDAYGITESRYYIALFGIYSITSGVILSIRPTSKTGLVILLSAAFAVFSVLPPVDAFTVSRNSQISTMESYLESEGILKDGKLYPKADVPEMTRAEITNKIDYLTRTSSLKYIEWLPKDFLSYDDFEKTFGFKQTYLYQSDMDQRYFHVELNREKPIVVTGYDVSTTFNGGRSYVNEVTNHELNIRGAQYTLQAKTTSAQEVWISVKDSQGKKLLETGLYEFVKQVRDDTSTSKDMMPPEDLSLIVNGNGSKLMIVFQSIDITEDTSQGIGVDYWATIYFAAPISK